MDTESIRKKGRLHSRGTFLLFWQDCGLTQENKSSQAWEISWIGAWVNIPCEYHAKVTCQGFSPSESLVIFPLNSFRENSYWSIPTLNPIGKHIGISMNSCQIESSMKCTNEQMFQIYCPLLAFNSINLLVTTLRHALYIKH